MSKMKHAFTLIELLIVVAIIAILAAIAVPNFLEAQVRSKVSRAKNDIRSLATALEAYCVDQNHYPPSYIPNRGWIDPWVGRLQWLTTPVAYMSSLPNDPFYPYSPTTQVQPVFIHLANTYNSQKGYQTYQYAEDFYGWPAYNKAVLPMALVDAVSGVDVTWVLISHGPDRVDNFMLPDIPGFDKLQLVYDATNGTISTGDIMRFGGPGGTGQ